MIARKAQPRTSSGLPASHHCSLADAVNVILNGSLPENQFTANSDSGKEINIRVGRHSTQLTVSPLDQLSAQAVVSCTMAELA